PNGLTAFVPPFPQPSPDVPAAAYKSKKTLTYWVSGTGVAAPETVEPFCRDTRPRRPCGELSHVIPWRGGNPWLRYSIPNGRRSVPPPGPHFWPPGRPTRRTSSFTSALPPCRSSPASTSSSTC